MQSYSSKTVQQRFLYTLTKDYQLAPKVAEQVLQDAQLCFQGQSFGLRPGQIRVILAHRNAKAGRLLSEIPTIEVTWTVNAGAEDEKILKRYGSIALRRVRIQRLICESLEQYGVPTQQDLANVLQASLRTIKRDFKVLIDEKKVLPSRGYFIGVGRGQTHKAQIIAFWLKGYHYDQIERETYHTSTSINRYIQTFVRVVECHRLGFGNAQITHLLQIGEPLVEEYLAVYKQNDQLERRRRLEDQLQRLAKVDQIPKKRSLS
jgi:hypothetical protein